MIIYMKGRAVQLKMQPFLRAFIVEQQLLRKRKEWEIRSGHGNSVILHMLKCSVNVNLGNFGKAPIANHSVLVLC